MDNIKPLPVMMNEPSNIKTASEKKKEWNDFFKNSGHVLVTIRFKRILTGCAVAFVLFSIVFGSLFSWALFTHRLDGIISSKVNTTIQNNYSFNPTTTAQIDDRDTNEYNIEFNFNEEFLNKLCEIRNNS